MNTIGDMQNQINFYGHCNEFEYNHDFLKFFSEKIDDNNNIFVEHVTKLFMIITPLTIQISTTSVKESIIILLVIIGNLI